MEKQNKTNGAKRNKKKIQIKVIGFFFGSDIALRFFLINFIITIIAYSVCVWIRRFSSMKVDEPETKEENFKSSLWSCNISQHSLFLVVVVVIEKDEIFCFFGENKKFYLTFVSPLIEKHKWQFIHSFIIK